MLLGGFEKEIIKLTDLHARTQLKKELASRAKEVKDFLDSCEALVGTVRAYIAAAEDSKAEDFLQLSDTDQQKMLDVCQQHIDNVLRRCLSPKTRSRRTVHCSRFLQFKTHACVCRVLFSTCKTAVQPTCVSSRKSPIMHSACLHLHGCFLI